MANELDVQLPDLDTTGILTTKGPFTKIRDFLDAVNDAEAGDMIILANGIYDVSDHEDTKFKGVGSPEHPIIVRAETVGGVTLQGSAGYKFDHCKFFTWYGFNHAHEATNKDDNIVFLGGENNRFARCDVKLDDIIKIDGKNIRPDELERKLSREEMEGGESVPNARHWLNISDCTTMKVDHCHFHHKETIGNFCIVGFGSDNKVGEGPIFEYNYFQHQDLDHHIKEEDMGDPGGEAVRIGHSGDMARKYVRAIFRYNFLEKCNGDGEIVTNKSSGNIYYNNSWVDNLGTLTLRHGDSTAVLGNYFEKCGLRVGGAYNLIANNHFTRNSADEDHKQRSSLVLHNGNSNKPKEGSWERVIDNYIILNTFANGEGRAHCIIYWALKADGSNSRPIGIRFRGNLVTAQNGMLLKFDQGGSASRNKIKDNIASIPGNANEGNLTDEMAKMVDFAALKLAMASDGINRLQSGESEASGLLQGKPFEDLTKIDIYGEERGPNTDAGCNQFSTVAEDMKPNKRIIQEHVGPRAIINLGDSPKWDPFTLQTREDRTTEFD